MCKLEMEWKEGKEEWEKRREGRGDRERIEGVRGRDEKDGEGPKWKPKGRSLRNKEGMRDTGRKDGKGEGKKVAG